MDNETLLEKRARAKRHADKAIELMDEIRSVDDQYDEVSRVNAGVHRATSEADKSFSKYLRTGVVSDNMVEYRATGTGLSSSPDNGQAGADNAGYMIPSGFWRSLTVAMKAYGGASSHYKMVETDTGNPMPWATIDPTAVEANLLTDELTQLAITNPYVFGTGKLQAWTLAVGPVLASLQLMRDSAFNVDAFITERFGEALGRKVASLAMTGTGTSQPLGLIPAISAKGAHSAGNSGGYIALTAGTTVKTFAATAPTELAGNLLSPETIVSMVKAIDPAYYPTAAWYMNSDQAWNLHTVVDANGRPLLSFMNGFDASSVRNGSQVNITSPVASIFGFPVYIAAEIPNLAASTVGGPVFGALDHAMVMRSVREESTVMRLDQRYADWLSIGFLGYYRFDVRSNDMRACVSVQCAAT